MKISLYRNIVSSLPTFGGYYVFDRDNIDQLKLAVRGAVRGAVANYETSEVYISKQLGNCFYYKNFVSKTLEVKCEPAHGVPHSGSLGMYVIDCKKYIVIEPDYVYGSNSVTILSYEDTQEVSELAGSCMWNFNIIGW